MSHRVQIIVNGRSYQVEIEDLTAAPLTVRVNGQAYTVEVTPAGEPVEVSARNEGERVTAVATPQTKTITAPLPGQIASIAVTVGDTIQTGQTLCTLEAMKMKNAIRSPRDGVIASIAVQEGQAVNHGDILLTFAS